MDALYAFLKKNVKEPYIAIQSAGYGTASVEFTVTPQGRVTNARYVRRCNVRVDEEVMRLTNLLSGWTPATKGGKPCSATLKLSMSLFPSYSADIKITGYK